MAKPLDNPRHASEDEIERYSMGAVPETEAAHFDEHLLICVHCQQKLEEADVYVAAMRKGIRQLVQEEQRRARRSLWIFPRMNPLFGAAALVAAAAVAFVWTGNSRKLLPAYAVNLEAFRGAAGESQAPPRRPLLLQLDLTSLAPSPTYRLEMVDQAGTVVWEGSVAALDAKASASIPPKEPGAYFVRIYLPSGEVLREYGLEVKTPEGKSVQVQSSHLTRCAFMAPNPENPVLMP
jgi:hypothetical protein